MRKLTFAVLAGALALSACGKKQEEPAPPPPPPPKPARGAVGDANLRMMLAEIASARACDMVKGAFRGVRAEGRHDVTTGVLWMRDCKITHDGTKLTFHLGGGKHPLPLSLKS